MYRIQKDFAFSASHQLEGLATGHQCGRLHGHNYIVRVQLRSRQLDDHGFVVDYGELAPVKRWIDDNMDHRHLNDSMKPFLLGANTTAENMAHVMAVVVTDLLHLPDHVQVAVGISETPKTWSWYETEASFL